MNWLERIHNVRILLIFVAVLIAIGSLLTSNYLIVDLQQREKTNMEVWAEAMRALNNADENTDLNLVIKVLNENTSIPIIVVGSDGTVLSTRNISTMFDAEEDSVLMLKEWASDWKRKGQSIRIDIPASDIVPKDDYMLICYDESLILTRLAVYPYIQLGVVAIFVIIALFAVFASMRSEQNKVWVGLSKETAHQLGTPISSLMAWNEVLKETYPDDVLLPEMAKDIKRLERIAERFSKIGSIPDPVPTDMLEILDNVVAYMDKRTSSRVVITTHFPSEPVIVNLIESLFEWVVENLCKNAVDAMNGSGAIDVYVFETDSKVCIEVADTGKGIPESKFDSVFKAGYTTKERGWGLGLSLARRIIVDYHKGEIFVKESKLDIGTTFRIELPKT